MTSNIEKINGFDGKNRFLSNFYNAPVTYNGVCYANSEAAFQAQKQPSRAREFTKLPPNKAKALGRNVSLRRDWDDIKLAIMRNIVHAKFKQNTYLANKLIKTGNMEIIEQNYWHDNIWGDCDCNRCKNKPGKNELGKILMELRTELQAK